MPSPSSLFSGGRLLVTLFRGALVALAIAGLARAAEAGSFLPSSNLTQNVRGEHTAVLLPNGNVAVFGGFSLTGGGFSYVSSIEQFESTRQIWGGAGSLLFTRRGHTSTLLANGKVLTTGGQSASGFNTVGNTCELYDYQSGSVFTGQMQQRRVHHTATLLHNGKVLVTGGLNTGNTVLDVCELYDPAKGTWTLLESMPVPRYHHTATLLADGRVLVVGGFRNSSESNATNAVSLFDPVTETWTTAASLPFADARHTATRLGDGRVFVAVGAGACIYTPATNAWGAVIGLAVSRRNHTAALLPDGKVLLAGGTDVTNTPFASVSVFDPATNTVAGDGSMATARYDHTATVLPGGGVVLAGGYGTSGFSVGTSQEYRFAAMAWATTGSLPAVRAGEFTSTPLPNGKMLMAGGSVAGSATNSALLYDPLTGVFTATGSMTVARAAHAAVLLRNGLVLVGGGVNTGGYLNTSETYDPATGTWTAAGNLLQTTAFSTMVLLPNGKAFMPGGFGGFLQNIGQTFDPVARTWSAPSSFLSKSRSLLASLLLPNGNVLIVGGQASGSGPDAWSNAVDLFNPTTNTFSATGSLNIGRDRPSLALLPDGRVLCTGGGIGVGTSTATAEIYNPATGTWSNTGTGSAPRSGQGTTLLLPNGLVLVAGGLSASGGTPTATETFEWGSGTWSAGPTLTAGHDLSGLVPLPNGKVLLAGGNTSVADLLDPVPGFATAAQPVIASAVVNASGRLVLTGTGFRAGRSGGTSTSDSPSNYPLVYLRWLDNGQTIKLNPASFSPTGYTSQPISQLRPGHVLVQMFVNGIPARPATSTNGVSVVNLTAPPAAVTTVAATLIAGSQAQLNATVTAASGVAGEVHFQFSTDSTFIYGPLLTVPVAFSGSASGQAIAANATGLPASSTIYFRAVAGGAGGAIFGNTLSFNTAANVLPLASNPTLGGFTGDAQTVLPTALGSDSDGDTLTLTAAAPANGNLTALSFTPSGGVTFTPALNFAGNATFTYTLSDGRGGTVNGTATVSVADNKAPSASITGAPPALTNSTSASFTFTGSDNIAVTAFEGSLDGAAFAPVTSPLNLPGLAEGPHDFQLRARDAAGNLSPVQTAIWTVDTTAPAITAISFAASPAASGWTTTGAQLDPRSRPAAALLPDSGKILLAGGWANPQTETFDPANGSRGLSGSMMFTRLLGMTATTLADGSVLIVGGTNPSNGQPRDAAERYLGGFWYLADYLSTPSYAHTVTLLPDGRALLVGGTDGTLHFGRSAFYDPSANHWSTGPALVTARSGHSATRLGNGKVLIAGGRNASQTTLDSAELFDPATGLWSSAGRMLQARADHSAVLLPNGEVLVASGNSAELFDPVSGIWSPTAAPILPRAGNPGVLALLGNGQVLMAGGAGRATELYGPFTRSWSAAGSTAFDHGTTPTLFALPNGSALLCSWDGSTNSEFAEIFRPVVSQQLRPGDTITLTFTLGEAGITPVVTIAGQGALVTPLGGNVWRATITVSGATTAGAVGFSINATDAAGNGAAASATSDLSQAIVALAPVERWRQMNFATIANTGPSADTADPDGDGLPNYAEFAQGSNPNRGTDAPLQMTGDFLTGTLTAPGRPIVRILGGDARGLFVRRLDATDARLVYTPQFSNDLQNWIPAPTAPSHLSVHGDYQLLTMPCPLISGQTARFFRVGVSMVP